MDNIYRPKSHTSDDHTLEHLWLPALEHEGVKRNRASKQEINLMC